MADTHHPPRPRPGEPPDAVRHDADSRISGPPADAQAEPVRAEHVRQGDMLVLEDGTVATVTDVRHGDYWLNTGHHGPGVAVGWRAGSSRGILFRGADAVLCRLAQ